MIYKSTSIKTLLANIHNAFGFEGNEWIAKAYDIIPIGMGLIGTSIPLEKTSVTKAVVNYRVELPCGLENLFFVTYNDEWLPLKSNSIQADRYRCDVCSQSLDYFGVLNPNYIQTTFETGDVVFYYESLPLDSDGLPMIPDDPFYTEALGWFLTYKLLTAGYKHPMIKHYREAYDMWERTCPRAQNSALFPTIDDMERLKNFWTSSVRDNDVLTSLVFR